MDNTKLLDRVRKLYAMSQDVSSPNEAAIAAKRARSLMDKHGIKASDLETSEFAELFASDRTFKAMPSWYGVLAVGVAVANDVQAIRTRGKVQFQGFEADVIGAQLMFGYLIEAMERHLKQASHLSGRADKGAFRQGFAGDMSQRLHALKEQRKQESRREAQAAGNSTGSALIVVKDKLVSQKYGSPRYARRSTTHSSRSGYSAGVNASQRTGLNTQVSGKAQGALR